MSRNCANSERLEVPPGRWHGDRHHHVGKVLHGAGTWTDISPETIRRLNAAKQWYWRLILQVGPSAPICSFSWEVAGIDMGVCVKKEKVLLALHLCHLDQEVYLEQLAMGWPGLATEVEQIFRELNIENVNTTRGNIYEYKVILSRACHIRNEVG